MIQFDQKVHQMRLTCDGKSGVLGCQVAIDVEAPTRHGCEIKLLERGWTMAEGNTHLCLLCTRRRLEAAQ